MIDLRQQIDSAVAATIEAVVICNASMLKKSDPLWFCYMFTLCLQYDEVNLTQLGILQVCANQGQGSKQQSSSLQKDVAQVMMAVAVSML